MITEDLGFSMEDIERAQRTITQGKSEEELHAELIKKLQDAEGKEVRIDKQVWEYAVLYAVRTLLAIRLMNVDNVEAIAMTLLVGIQMGIVIEQTRPGTFRLEYMEQGRQA